jgi:hypothetical protein
VTGRLASAASILAAFAVAYGAACRTASAQEPADRTATAAGLFDEAKALMDRGNYADACPKLAESQAIDPQVGTMMNLALCYESVGKVASACQVWREAADAAARKMRPDRAELARQHGDSTCPRAPQVTVQIADQPQRDALSVTIDGAPLAREQWGLPAVVDAGDHEMRATGEGLQPWSSRFRVEDQQAAAVLVPILAPAASPQASVPAIVASTGQQQQSRVIGAGVWVAAGIGAAALAASGAFGVVALSRLDESNEGRNCVQNNCNSIGASDRVVASRYATASDVSLAVGVGAIATSVVLWAIAPRAGRPTSGGYVQPAVSQNQWSLAAGGTW